MYANCLLFFCCRSFGLEHVKLAVLYLFVALKIFIMIQLKATTTPTLVLMDKVHGSSTMYSCSSVSTVLGSREMLTSAAIFPTGLDSHARNALQIDSLSV